MQKHILSVNNLSKQFGSFQAVRGVSFDIKKGEIVGLLGPNGAGKTTTIQMLLGLTKPTQGTIAYFGLDLLQNRSSIMQRVNSTSGYARMPWKLTVFENLFVYAHLFSVKNPKQKIHELAETFEMNDLLSKKFMQLSAGQVTRCMLAKCFLNDPEIVLLDEPTASLDPDIAEKIREYLLSENKRRNMSILITSHNMQEVEQLCERVIMLNKGTIYAIDTPSQLASRNRSSVIHLYVDDGKKRLMKYLKQKHIVFEENNRLFTLTIEEKDIVSFLNQLAEERMQYKDIEIVRPSLEDFFLSLAHTQ